MSYKFTGVLRHTVTKCVDEAGKHGCVVLVYSRTFDRVPHKRKAWYKRKAKT